MRTADKQKIEVGETYYYIPPVNLSDIIKTKCIARTKWGALGTKIVFVFQDKDRNGCTWDLLTEDKEMIYKSLDKAVNRWIKEIKKRIKQYNELLSRAETLKLNERTSK